MALKSVVADSFFEDVGRVLSMLERVKGPFSLVLLTASQHHRTQWDVTVAAPWIDDASLLNSISDVKQFLVSRLGESNFKLGRVKVRTTFDSLVRTITSAVEIPLLGAAYRISGLDLDLFGIDEAVCLLSRPVSTDAALQKVPA